MLGALPGLREIRSALAGGYLWIAFLWLALDPVLGQRDFTEGPYKSAHHLGNEVGPVALSVGLTFAAYLIGTFVNEGRELAGRLYLRARQSVSRSSAVKQREELVDELEQARTEVRARFRNLFVGTPDAGAPAEENRAVTIAVQAFPLLISIPMTAFKLPAVLALKFIEWSERLIFWLLRKLIAKRAQPYRPFLSKQGVKAVKRYIAGTEPGLADGELDVADVIADFSVVRTRLIHRSPDTVSEYDRLRAEAGFRSAIVPPLVAIAGLFALKVSPWWLLTWPILLTLLLTAQVRRREAGDILADVLGIVDAPSAELGFDGAAGAEQLALPVTGEEWLAE